MKTEEAKNIIINTFDSKFIETEYHKFTLNLFKNYEHVHKVREGHHIKHLIKCSPLF